jgi:hypothetical protein
MDLDASVFLQIANFALDTYRKRHLHLDYSNLFQPGDAYEQLYSWADEDNGPLQESTETAYQTTLRTAVSRLDLLGYSYRQIRDWYEEHRLERDRNPNPHLNTPPYPPFDILAESLRTIDVGGIPTDDPRTRSREALARVATRMLSTIESTPAAGDHVRMKGWFEIILGGLDPFTILQVLAQEPVNPEISDFFDFIDMAENYPLTGVGNLHNFYQGLLKIGVLNNMLFIYDNDTEGTTKFTAATQLDSPPNIRTMRLPDLPAFERFATIGPTGEQQVNINGKAVSIECFLDFQWQRQEPPRVRWTVYHRGIGQYQGELEGKQEYLREFLALDAASVEAYDTSKLEVLLDNITIECARIGEARVNEDWQADGSA